MTPVPQAFIDRARAGGELAVLAARRQDLERVMREIYEGEPEISIHRASMHLRWPAGGVAWFLCDLVYLRGRRLDGAWLIQYEGAMLPPETEAYVRTCSRGPELVLWSSWGL